MPSGLPGPSSCLLFPAPPLVRCDPWFYGARGSPGDLSSLSLANHGHPGLPSLWGACSPEGTHGGALQVCPPVRQRSWPSLHWHPPAHFLSPLPPASQPASQAAALFWDANIHTLLEPQIKGGVPRPASQWFLCADRSLRGVRTQAERRGCEGAQYKDTRHPEKPAEDEAKRGTRWRMYPARCWKMQMRVLSSAEKKTRSCVWFQWKGQQWLASGAVTSVCPGGCRWAKAAWGNRVAVTSPWAQRQRK